MNLLCVGINHRTAPLEAREGVWFSNEEIRRILPHVREKYLRECVMVSTCNRTELYGLTSEDLNGEELKKVLIRHKGAESTTRPEHFYMLRSLSAVKHLFSVTSGIDSMILGDVQILNQMKEAFEIARDAKTLGTILLKLFHAAFHSGKRVRTETEIGEGAVSVSYAAVELASKIFDDLSNKKALLVGAGDTGKLTAKHLIGKKIGKLYLANRTRERAEDIGALLGATVVDFANFQKTLEDVDIVVTALEAPHYVLSSVDVRMVMKHRASNPLYIVDIGVPRNVDPGVNRIDNVFLHNIDTLNLIVDKNLGKRRAEIPKVQQIIHEELLKFYRWYRSLEVAPTIQELHDRFEAIRKEEVGKTIHRFSQEEKESIELLTKRIIHKILHTPLMNLKNGANGEANDETLDKISTLRSLFGLGSREDKEFPS